MTHGTLLVVDGYDRLAEDRLDDHDRLGEPDVRERGRVDHVADGEDAVDAGAHLAVDDDEAAVVDLDAGLLEADPAAERRAPDRDDDLVDHDRVLTRSFSQVTVSSVAPSMPVTRDDVLTLMPRFLNERATTLPASTSVGARIRGSASMMVTSLPMSASIDANSAPITPPPMMATRAGSSSSSSTWSDDSTRVPSKSRPRERARIRAGGDHEVGALDLGAVGETHLVRRGVDHLTTLVEHGDLAPLEERLEALGEPVDDLALARLRPGQVERRHPRVDAEVRRPLDRAQHLGGLQELLGRDATPVQAGPTDPDLLDQRDVETGRRAVQRGRVPSRTATEDHDVELLGQDGHLLE